MNFSIKSRLFILFILAQTIIASVISAVTPSTIYETEGFQTGQQSTFISAECMFKLPVGFKEGDGIQCGYLTVPEEHANPNGPTLKLAVVIIKRRTSDTKSRSFGYGARWTWRLNYRNLRSDAAF